MTTTKEKTKLFEVKNTYKNFEYDLYISKEDDEYFFAISSINTEVKNAVGVEIKESFNSLDLALKYFNEDSVNYNNDLMTLFASMYAFNAHKGQKDLAGEDYIKHPMFVRDRFSDSVRRTVAVLHDVVEDTKYTLKDLEEIFPKDVVEAVDAITRRKNKTYKESDDIYYERIYQNEIATDVKIQDNLHNMLFYRLHKLEPTVEDAKRLKAYANHVYDSIMLKQELKHKHLS